MFSRSPGDHLEVRRSPIHGHGLFAAGDIDAGSHIGFYQGEETSEDGMHVLWVEQDDGGWIGYDGNNELRYLNHSTRPNCELDGQELFALRDIGSGEELTIDYGAWFDPETA